MLNVGTFVRTSSQPSTKYTIMNTSILNVVHIVSFNYLFCSTKYLKGLSKDNSSPFFLDVGSKNPIFRTVYDLLSNGVKGNIKKDVLLAIISDILVGLHIDIILMNCPIFFMPNFAC